MTTKADHLLHYLQIIIRTDISDWDREFCISILGRMNRGPFTPSPAQSKVIIRIVEDFKSRTMRDDDPVIEGADEGGR